MSSLVSYWDRYDDHEFLHVILEVAHHRDNGLVVT